MTEEELEARIKQLEAELILLNLAFQSEHEASLEWQKLAEQRAKSITDFQAELTDCIKKRTDLKKKYRNTVNDRTMFQWFLEYLEDHGKETSYSLIVERALEEGLLKKEINIRAMRQRLQKHCKYYNIPYP